MLLTLNRISFIGHSLGGLIIRAALPHLSEYQNNMYSFLTLSSPHLGYLYNTSSIIDTGINNIFATFLKNYLPLTLLTLIVFFLFKVYGF